MTELPFATAQCRPLPAVLLLVAGFGVSLWLAGLAAAALPLGTWADPVGALIPLATAAVLLWALGLLPQTLRPGWLGRGLLLGWYLPAAGALVLALSALSWTAQGGGFSAPPLAALGAVLGQLGTAAIEELFFRAGVLAVLAGALLGTGRMGPRGVVALSAAIFGLAHLLNLIHNPGALVPVLGQVVYAALLGLLLGAVWLRTRSTGAVILLHFLFNCGAAVGAMFDPEWSRHVLEAGEADTSVGAAISTVVFAAPAGLIGWLLLSRRRT